MISPLFFLWVQRFLDPSLSDPTSQTDRVLGLLEQQWSLAFDFPGLPVVDEERFDWTQPSLGDELMTASRLGFPADFFKNILGQLSHQDLAYLERGLRALLRAQGGTVR